MTYTNKTQATNISPIDFLKDNYPNNKIIENETLVLIDIYTKVINTKCIMWNKIFGFGKYYYNDSKGYEHSYLAAGFVISKTGFTLYNIMGWDHYNDYLEKLGKYKITGKSCLSIKSVNDIDIKILTMILKKSFVDLKKVHRVEI